MQFEIRADGADTLARTLDRAADDLGSALLGAETAAEFRKAAAAGAPVLTGALRASISVAGPVVTVGVVYGGPIVGGWRAHGIDPHPWMRRLWDADERWADVMEAKEIQPIVDQIRGA